ncbi:hypothetical protein [Cyanobium sp. ATX-6F1]|uniref:hypothetical protein n=1 Tax=Cyanobium sp. ATX-6F1 TaxID=3137388 RepID=UPI0039BDD44E
MAGLVIGGGVLGLVWPPADPAALDQARDSAALSPLPDRPITVLVIGTDADRLGATTNGAAPRALPTAMPCSWCGWIPRARCRCWCCPPSWR